MDWLSVSRGIDGLGAAWRRRTVRFRPRTRPFPDSAGSMEFEPELVELGLSGEHFGPREYAEALQDRLGIRILFSFVDPIGDPAALRRLAVDGRLAEARHLARADTVLISLPANLPPFLLTLTVLHELAHVAAGDVVTGRRIARKEPSNDDEVREDQADARACYLYLAGTLGPENPYAVRLHGVP